MLSACMDSSNHPLPHQAYIWQRHWTNGVYDAMALSEHSLQGWRILAAELNPNQPWFIQTPPSHLNTHLPITLVVRLDGQIAQWDKMLIQEKILATLALWESKHIPISALEIDYDAPNSKLEVYSDFLTALDAQLPSSLTLSITTLPAWLSNPQALSKLLAKTDHAVLQVHAVLSPHQGLFNRKQATQWVDAFSKIAPSSWSIAIPNYGSKVIWDADGNIIDIQSESVGQYHTQTTQELMARPKEIQYFINDIEALHPKGMQSWIWFRLPTDTNQRAWSIDTWLAVVNKQALRPTMDVTMIPHAHTTDLRQVVVKNTGNADGLAPGQLKADAACLYAGGHNEYTPDISAPKLVLRTEHPRLLRTGESRVLAWIRCPAINAWTLDK